MKKMMTNELSLVLLLQKKGNNEGSGSNNKNQNAKGVFTWKIVKKKAQFIEKGKVIAFGTSAGMKTEELSREQILERNK